jgi:hypothetical protein
MRKPCAEHFRLRVKSGEVNSVGRYAALRAAFVLRFVARACLRGDPAAPILAR